MTKRVRQIKTVADKMERSYLERSIGEILPVLFEMEGDGASIGHSDTYALVQAEGSGLHGFVKNVKISAVSGKMLIGSVC